MISLIHRYVITSYRFLSIFIPILPLEATHQQLAATLRQIMPFDSENYLFSDSFGSY
jgi:hypothetical protein